MAFLNERIATVQTIKWPTHHPKLKAIVRFRKLYRLLRRRRQLADEEVLKEQKWFKLLDDNDLKQIYVPSFGIGMPNVTISRWWRARKRVAKVGKGFSKNGKAQTLVDHHWLEVIDPCHRYGHNLKFYFEYWNQCGSNQQFFHWLDVGDGQEISIDKCPRSMLQQQRINYLVQKESEDYEVVVEDGKFLYKRNGNLVCTSKGPENTKWMFVLSTSKTLYVGQKKKGNFQHSSFLGGGVASAAGGFDIENGVLKAVTLNSGHYQPGLKDLLEFVIFLDENNVDLTEVKICLKDGDEDIRFEGFADLAEKKSEQEYLPKIIDLLKKNRNKRHDLDQQQSHAIENESE